ncbi:elongation factor 1-beta [Methanopyrus kandleri]
MSKVLVDLKVLPESADVDYEELKEAIREKLESMDVVDSIEGMEEEPIAFGLKAIRVKVVVPDAEGGTDALEDALKEVDEVNQVEVVSASRTL